MSLSANLCMPNMRHGGVTAGIIAALSSSSVLRGQVAPASVADSVVLERTRCLGTGPERIDEHEPELCESYATDHPTVTVSIWRATGSKRVVHYHGCGPVGGASEPLLRLRRLASLEAAIDSVAGTRRWVRPAKPPWPPKTIR